MPWYQFDDALSVENETRSEKPVNDMGDFGRIDTSRGLTKIAPAWVITQFPGYPFLTAKIATMRRDGLSMAEIVKALNVELRAARTHLESVRSAIEPKCAYPLATTRAFSICQRVCRLEADAPWPTLDMHVRKQFYEGYVREGEIWGELLAARKSMSEKPF